MPPAPKPPYDPWYKITLKQSALGKTLALRVPHDVFSTQQIDEGTLLLLQHLPARDPARVLDLGCGYGALGLPIAAKYPSAQIEMVDRDLLAAQWSGDNARSNGLDNVDAYGSLGYRDLRSPGAAYDWILCNVPARIGRPFITELLEKGRALLSPAGELRVVVINDLVPMLREIEAERGWPLREIVRGPRHSVLALDPKAESAPTTAEALAAENADLYLRDRVEIERLGLDRPFDLGGDDPKRLKFGLPALIDALPRQFEGRALCFRCGYGQVPLVMRARCPQATVFAVDRDLLATDFTRRNAKRLGLDGERLLVREHATLPQALAAECSRPSDRLDLILGELSPSAGEKVLEAELTAITKALRPGGQALLLCLEKLDQQWVRPFVKRAKLSIHPVLMREGYAVLSLRA